MVSVKLVKNILVFCVLLMHVRGGRFEAGADDASTDGEARIIYDQRQSGKYNIHVVIKDVAIIEMDQNEIEDVCIGESCILLKLRVYINMYVCIYTVEILGFIQK